MLTDERFAEEGVTFGSFFEATVDEWTEVFVPFSELEATWRGTPFPIEFDPEKLQEVGFVLNEVSYDKVPGDFRLEIQWIAAV